MVIAIRGLHEASSSYIGSNKPDKSTNENIRLRRPDREIDSLRSMFKLFASLATGCTASFTLLCCLFTRCCILCFPLLLSQLLRTLWQHLEETLQTTCVSIL